MSKAIITIMLVTTLTALALLPGCTTTGVGKVVTEEKDFTDFTYVDIEGTFEVEITQSDSFSVTIRADEDFYDYVAVAKEGDTLRIYLNPRHTFTDFTLQARALKATITMPALYGIQLAGASKGTITGFKSTRDFTLNVSGASSLDLEDIEVDDAEFEISGASKVTGSINATDMRFEISGASTVKLEGSAEDTIIDASGASEVDLAGLPLNDADVRLSGASEASLDVRDRLDAALSAASRLYFLGNPTMGNVSVTGASTIKHK